MWLFNKEMKRLLACPICFINGHKEILGELDEDGNIIIKRFHNGSTKIVADSYKVICGNCNNMVYYRKNKND